MSHPTNPFQVRRLRPGYARLRGKLGRGTDSAAIIADGSRASVVLVSYTNDRHISSAARYFRLKAWTVVPK